MNVLGGLQFFNSWSFITGHLQCGEGYKRRCWYSCIRCRGQYHGLSYQFDICSNQNLSHNPVSVIWMVYKHIEAETKWPPFRRRHFSFLFVNENGCISFDSLLRFVSKGQIDNIPALVQIVAWRRPGDKPLSEPMMVNLLTYICVTWPQWVNNGISTVLHGASDL